MSAPWHHGPLLAFDLETTGPDPDHARVVTSTLLELDGANRAPRHWVRAVHEHLVNPGVDIPAGATAVHGISTEHARTNGRPTDVVLFELLGHIALGMRRGATLVGFNLAYDLTVLDREARRHGIDTLTARRGLHAGDHEAVAPVVDAYVLDKQVDRYRRGSRKLTDVAEHYGVSLTEAHTSSADALAAAAVACSIAERYPAVGDTDVRDLHRLQIGWRAEQSRSLQAYLRKKDPAVVVDGAWPVQPVDTAWDPSAHPVEAEAA